MAATIKIKNSSTASAVPTSSDLVQGELAVNVTDKRIFTENASGTVVELGTNPSSITLPDGSASAPTLTNDGDTNTGIFFPAADTVGISTGGTERARVDSSGNLGVGASTSNGRLTLKNPSAGSEQVLLAIQAASSTSAIGRITYDQTVDTLRFTNMSSYSGATTRFGNNGLDQVTLDLSGNLGLGVTPSAWSGFTALQIQNGALFTDSTSFRSIMNGYYNGSNWIYNTSNYATRYEQLNGIHRWFNAASGTAGNTITFTQAMTLDASGNLGIGKTSPTVPLSFADSAGTAGTANKISLYWATGETYGLYGFGVSSGQLDYVTGGAHVFYSRTTNTSTERARIDSSGNLLVGTTSNTFSSAKGLITGSQTSGGQGIYDIYNSDSTTASDPAPVMTFHKASTTTTSSARFLQFYANAATTPMGGIVGNGSSNVQFASISDIREKTNIQNINGSLAKINALRPVEFDWIADGSHVPAGFVAQEVEQVFPEFVVENMSNDGQEERKGLTGGMTGGIVAHLVKAIQEQQAIITQLQADVAALKG